MMMPFKTRAVLGTMLIGLYLGNLIPAASASDACKQWAAKIVSLQGIVQVRKVGQVQWQQAQLNETYCAGDMIRVKGNSRAAFILSNESLLRLDQNTTVTITGIEKEKIFILDLLSGMAHFFSRFRKSLKVVTPFVNAAVEGTEFTVRVDPHQVMISIFEGRVAASNKFGSMVLSDGESAVARAGQTPARHIVLRPRDAVTWAIYYPPIISWRRSDFSGGDETGWRSLVRTSIDNYWQADLAGALSALDKAPEGIQDPNFFVYRAALYLSVGRVEAAQADISQALKSDSGNAYAFALQSVIAVARNKTAQAYALAAKAVESNPQLSVPRVALSYAQQSQFDIQGALNSLQKAVELDPENALAFARLSELYLSAGKFRRALDTARKAVELNSNLARTQTVLGYALITQTRIPDAKHAFEKAIRLDSAAPLPRLGLGLALIREGNLELGRAEIEVAAALDPNKSLIRSYLGKAYYEEKRDRLAANQYAVAKKLDPLDPTPWFYDAIRKQTVNRPVEALHDLQKSIELNDNRAVFRSRFLLDQDLAARSASLGRIYNNLGFQQLALVQGWRSLYFDQANFSAHRFLADTYATLPRHEIARVSELLQSQLLQPINITPVQPQLAEANLFILDGAGPADLSFNEFNPMFLRNRFALQASGIAGENETWGNDLIQSTVWGKVSYSAGQFHYETDGFRQNNDQQQDIINAFVQVAVTPITNVQAEYRYTDKSKGDLPLRFDPDLFFADERNDEQSDSLRLGFHHTFSPRSHFIASFIYQDAESKLSDSDFGFTIKSEDEGYLAEIQQQHRIGYVNITGGFGYFDADRDDTNIFDPFPPEKIDTNVDHINLYGYVSAKFPQALNWTLGASGDFLDGTIEDKDQFNPKFGLTWTPFNGTTLRGAVFRTLQRTLISNQTIEPTQIAGFNQLFDDAEGVDAWRYGVAIDQEFSNALFGGVEFSQRDLEVPFEDFQPPLFIPEVREADWKERLLRTYLYWTPHRWLAVSAEYQYEDLDRDSDFVGDGLFTDLQTHRIPLGINFFHPTGLTTRLNATYVDQGGDFGDPLDSVASDDDRFWVVDAAIGYRLPKRFGFISIEAKNLFDEQFKFQDTDPANPRIIPGRMILGKITLSF